MKILLSTFILIGLTPLVFSQSFEPVELNYYLLPATQIKQTDDDAYQNVDKGPVQIFDARLRYPIRLQRVILTPEINYSDYFQNVSHWPDSEDAPDHAQLIGGGCSFIFPTGHGLAFVGNLGLSSGFQQGVGIMDSKKLFRASVGFILAKDSLTKIGISIAYVKVLNMPLPVLVFHHTFPGSGSQISLAFPFRGTVEFPVGTRTSLTLEEHLLAGRFSLNNPGIIQTYNTTQVALTAGIHRQIKGPLYMSLAGGFVILDGMKLFDDQNNKVNRLMYKTLHPMCTASVYLKISADR